MTLAVLLRRWFCKPIDGDQLLMEARVSKIGEQDVLLFDRSLSRAEADALKEAWQRRKQGHA